MKGITFFLFSYFFLSALAVSPSSLRFAVIGDWGSHSLGTDNSQAMVAGAMSKVAENFKLDFIISVGDNFYENGVRDLGDPLFVEDWVNMYSSPTLQVPWYVVFGNHDYMGNLQPQIDFSKKHPLWRFPARYYTQNFSLSDGTTVGFVFLDTTPFTVDADDLVQWDWLQDTLTSLKTDWKVVVGHHPVLKCSSDEGDDFTRFEKKLKDILESNNIPVYISGHQHNLEHLAHQYTNYFISGSGGKLKEIKHHCKHGGDDTKMYFSLNGFMTFELFPTKMDVRFWNSSASNLYETTVKRPSSLRQHPAPGAITVN